MKILLLVLLTPVLLLGAKGDWVVPYAPDVNIGSDTLLTENDTLTVVLDDVWYLKILNTSSSIFRIGFPGSDAYTLLDSVTAEEYYLPQAFGAKIDTIYIAGTDTVTLYLEWWSN